MKKTLLLVLLVGCGQHPPSSSILKEAMNPLNDPKLIPGSASLLEYEFKKLPESGKVERLWTGHWWPLSQNGTAARRQQGSRSPMEKYDDAVGSGDAATAWEIAASKPYASVAWAGHCNGLAAAGIMSEEPLHAVTYNGVTFTTEDIKALLVEKWQGSGRIIGDRCDRKTITYDRYGRIVEDECRDLNPATLHIALANYLGLFGKAIIADMDISEAVWNYPLESYLVLQSEFLTNDEAIWRIKNESSTVYSYNPNAVDFVHIRLSLTFLKFDPKTYEYILELDQKGKILGGEWLGKSKREHPDFIWRPADPRAENPNLDLQIIDNIYKQSL